MTDNGKNTPHLTELATQLQGWVDNRIVSQEDISVWYRFLVYLVNLAEADGWEYTGHSLSLGVPTCRLVVRSELAGVPHVAFSSGRTPTGCMKSFLRKMEGGFLDWSKDKYRS